MLSQKSEFFPSLDPLFLNIWVSRTEVRCWIFYYRIYGH